jgi:hypothetical protein
MAELVEVKEEPEEETPPLLLLPAPVPLLG